ncbi:hypothetical protein CYLTODRAFT_460278 [Cylindrobasidium torrendii FP15055 ss-10]|uniref:CxC2-like cysteine cluster KDZ transposase-associated domain-containing protein n=1 Tax=Cylindrobasidium torrendii FP15055 ss-10 TaxID=1314674 RepID=A0A0D7AUH8_9AGAR|nr:hypothetical protein CYLTODRAFT_460278 [Cylindrobasidium torrendii FP15055 ss-10]
MARGGLAHLPGGIQGASWGAAATRCWACPRPDFNLPEGWENAPENVSFKYCLYLGLDANFRLENRMRKKAEGKVYEGLGEGLGCLAPSQHYFSHLAKGITEEEAKACTAFAAITQRDSRLDHGLRATGVAGCSCTRHELVRPLGWADTPKGERFITMDYVFWASLLKERLRDVFVTYDIGCQWRINLLGPRYGDVPEELAYKEEDRPTINVALPVFHSSCHEESCGSAESCRHKVGAAMTDGEGVERVWAGFNKLAPATKEMHQDVRYDALEDAIDYYNWRKNLGFGIHLRRKLEVAKAERQKQQESFAITSETVSDEDRATWTKMIEDWHKQEYQPLKKRTVKNPYSLAEQKAENLSEARVAQILLASEKDDAADGKDTMAGIAGFVRMGLQLQKIQIRIAELKRSSVSDHSDTKVKIEELRIRFLRKLRDYQALQGRYMTAAMGDIIAAERSRQADTDAENIKIYLPSDLDNRQRSGLEVAVKAEAAFRRAHSTAALTIIRHRLHMKSHFIRFRHKNWRGQIKYTRSQRILKDLDDSIVNYRKRYEIGRNTLERLQGASAPKEFRPLLAEDISTKWVTDYDGAAARKLAKVGVSGKHAPRNYEVQPAGQANSQAPTQSTSTTQPSASQTVSSQGNTASAIASPPADPDQALYDAWVGEEAEADGAERRGQSRRTMSWIWTAGQVPTTGQDAYLREAICIEWSKVYARHQRWTEEVILLEEEQRRVLESLRRMESSWRSRAEAYQGQDTISRGKSAYARRQMDVFGRIRRNFTERFEAEEELGVSGKKRKTPPST